MNSQITLQPGPIIPELLFLHQEHRASYLFNNRIPDCQLTARRCDNYFWQLVPYIPESVMVHIREAGFGGFIRCGNIQLDHALITALVERWRPETHTFHFPFGEATVTLQDVEVLWGLKVEGEVVSGTDFSKSIEEWQQYCQIWMGFLPSANSIRGSVIYLSTLFEQLCTSLPINALVEIYIQRARIYILCLLGGSLLPESSSASVPLHYLYSLEDLSMCGQLSWGSAILACLYRRLCKASNHRAKEISGPLVLLQIWAWERITVVRPIRQDNEEDLSKPYGARWNCSLSHRLVTSNTLPGYRDQFACLKEDEFIWTPYSHVLHALPIDCTNGRDSWRCVTYLICWEIVEAHLPNRVLRQFGMHQPIPVGRLLDNHHDLHKLTRKNQANRDWILKHQQYVDHWHNRSQHVEYGNYSNTTSPTHEYMQWYWPCTVVFIINPVGHRQNIGLNISNFFLYIIIF